LSITEGNVNVCFGIASKTGTVSLARATAALSACVAASGELPHIINEIITSGRSMLHLSNNQKTHLRNLCEIYAKLSEGGVNLWSPKFANTFKRQNYET